MFMDIARAASRRSTCFRLNVGAIVVQKNNPIAIGWNGQEPGAPHCAGNECPGIVPGQCGTLHAETNALLKAHALLRRSDAAKGVDLYCTHSPCRVCSEYIRNTSPLTVERIFFEIPYRDTSHLAMFRVPTDFDETTEVYEVSPAGYVIEYFTRQVVQVP